MAFTSHPLRRRVVEEMHLRRFPALAGPTRIVQIVRLTDMAARAPLPPVPARFRPVRDGAGRHWAFEAPDGATLLVEAHSEATTATMIVPGLATDGAAQGANGPFSDATPADGLAWLESLPGLVVRATRAMLVADEAAAAPVLAQAGFAADELVCCDIGGGIRLWSDFRLHADGYGRLAIAANGAEPGDLGRIVQRLQELGNYRNMALLGLPVAQEQGRRMTELEDRLAALARQVAAAGDDDESALEQLSALSAEIARITADSGFRMSATAAYARIAAERLAILAVQPLPGHQSLKDFTERRLTPAVRTCASFSARLETLASRTARVTALLRTRIETRIERQNRDLLQSMERSIAFQLRLQHLVEGLSVLAVSYYAIGLAGYMARGVERVAHGFDHDLWLALAVPPVVAAMVLLIRYRRIRITADDGTEHL